MINMPRNDCNGCFVVSPYVRVGTYGDSICQKNPIDVDSELMGLNRKNSKCPTKQYIPQANDFCVAKNLKDCNLLDSQDTRLTNPPCTLRGTGWNRWEALCQNPQDFAIRPFNTLINNSLIVKDNHRPCIAKPLDPTAALPSPLQTKYECATPIPCVGNVKQPYPPKTEPTSTTWRTGGAVQQMYDGPCNTQCS
jgi:hypothetical protein